jgi:hypothetical protein
MSNISLLSQYFDLIIQLLLRYIFVEMNVIQVLGQVVQLISKL